MNVITPNMTYMLSLSRRLRQLGIASCVFLIASASWAGSKSKNWQTGKLVKREALTFSEMTDLGGCFLPQAIFTVDSSTYTYEFVGFSYALTLTRPSVVFKIYPDGSVFIRDKQNRHSVELKVFEKLAGPSYTSIAVPPRKPKHRDWINAKVSAASPNIIDFRKARASTSSAPKSNALSPCWNILTSWEYTIEVQGKSYALFWPNVAPLNVTINGAIQIAFGKSGAVYLIDDNGKERKVRVEVTGKDVLQ